MELILWRHADAEDGIPDSERKLTPRGVKQAARMAKWLQQRIPEGALVVASPALRAQQTAHALTPDFRTAVEIGTAGGADDVLLASHWPRGNGTVVVVGHQPTLGETAALLLTGARNEWQLKKGAIVWIAYPAGGALSRPHLRAWLAPDLL